MKKAGKAKSVSERRHLIIEAAITCFIKHGVVATTFKQIAKEAKVHQPLIGYYFPTFDSLFAAVVERILVDLRDISVEAIEGAGSDTKKALLEYSVAPLHWEQKRPGFSGLWTFFYHMASYQPMFKAMNDSIRRVGRERISLLLYKYQEEKRLKLKKGWSVDRLAYVIQAQITGGALMTVTETSDLKEATALCQNAVEVFLDVAFER